MVGAWHGVAEGVQPPRRVRVELARVGEEDAARAHGGAHEPGANDACPDRRRRVVTPTRGHGDTWWQAKLSGDALAQGASVFGAFVDLRHPLVWDL